MRTRFLLASAGAVAAAVVLAGATPAAAAPTAPAGVVKACIDSKTGAFRWVSSSTTKCRTGEWLTSWNAPGPAGPKGVAGDDGVQGLRGVTGLTGAAGAQGLAGTSGVALTPETRLVPVGITTDQVGCDDLNAVALAGSVVLDLGEGAHLVSSSQAYYDPSNWIFKFSGPLTVGATVKIICAGVPM